MSNVTKCMIFQNLFILRINVIDVYKLNFKLTILVIYYSLCCRSVESLTGSKCKNIAVQLLRTLMFFIIYLSFLPGINIFSLLLTSHIHFPSLQKPGCQNSFYLHYSKKRPHSSILLALQF